MNAAAARPRHAAVDEFWFCLSPRQPTSASGTNRTSWVGLMMSVPGGISEVAFRGRQDRF
jgi:hypothetical protein